MMDADQQDIDAAAEYQQTLDEIRRREDELLARAPAAHAELERIRRENEETGKAMRWALERIFREG